MKLSGSNNFLLHKFTGGGGAFINIIRSSQSDFRIFFYLLMNTKLVQSSFFPPTILTPSLG